MPRRFTVARPAFQFAHETIECRFEEHPLTQLLPNSTSEGVWLSAPLDDLRQYGHAAGFPKRMSDLIDKDTPQLAFKIIQYSDATVFATTFSHCTWDISGALGLMKGIQLVLDGREDEVPAMLGASSDVLTEMAGLTENRDHDSRLAGMMAQRPTKERVIQPNQLEERLLRVPLDVFQNLHSYVADEDQDEDQDTWSTYQPDELFLALLIQQIAKAGPSGDRSLNLLNILNARLVVPPLAKADGVYTQNMVLMAPEKLEYDPGVTTAGSIAVAQRRCIDEFATPENIAKSLHTFLGAIQAGIDTTALVSGEETTPLLINHLIRLTNEMDMDLSSVVLRQGDQSDERRNGIGTMDFIYLTIAEGGHGIRRITTYGSYDGASCWVIGELPAEAWRMLEETLEDLA